MAKNKANYISKRHSDAEIVKMVTIITTTTTQQQ